MGWGGLIFGIYTTKWLGIIKFDKDAAVTNFYASGAQRKMYTMFDVLVHILCTNTFNSLLQRQCQDGYQ